MNKKEIEIIIQRIELWYNRLPGLLIYDQKVFDAHFGWSKDPTRFEDRLSLDYKPISEGDPWGEKWESAWFHLRGNVSKKWSGKTIAANLDFSGEGLVYDSDGKILQGITNASIWDSNFARTRVPIIDSCDGDENLDL